MLRARARGRDGRLSDWAAATVSFGGPGVPPTVVPAGFRRESGWVAGLRNATAFAPAPDGRLFVAEQDGAVRVVRNGVLLAKPFHAFDVDSRGERGVIGIALHPDFVRNGFVYVYHTTREGGTHNRISRLVASGDVSTGAATALVELPVLSSATNHNGGGMLFGADGMLYVGVGENAQGALAQDLSTPLGKLLRLRDDGSVPPDNPFAASRPGLAGAIWSYGLRNPYTLAVQPGSGRIHVNDVGAGRWEEIDLAAAGANFGWPGSEGPDGVSAGVTAPIFAYGHTATDPPGSGPGGFFTGIAIAGGAFYPAGGSFPAAYHGSYFFGDFTGGFVARLDPADPAGACAFARIDGTIVDLRVGADGALYVLQRDRITRIAPA